MEKLDKEFRKQYDFLYEADGNNIYVVGSKEALAYFDNNLTSAEIEILRSFVRYRGDFITSDREAIAFMFAIDNLEEGY